MVPTENFESGARRGSARSSGKTRFASRRSSALISSRSTKNASGSLESGFSRSTRSASSFSARASSAAALGTEDGRQKSEDRKGHGALLHPFRLPICFRAAQPRPPRHKKSPRLSAGPRTIPYATSPRARNRERAKRLKINVPRHREAPSRKPRCFSHPSLLARLPSNPPRSGQIAFYRFLRCRGPSLLGHFAPSHARSNFAVNGAQTPAQRSTTRSLSCFFSPEYEKFAEPVRSSAPSTQ